MPDPRPIISNAKIVQSFRGEQRAAPPLHPMERALVIVACLHLCFLPWALGARAPWAQLCSLGLGLVSFLIAVIPRSYAGALAPQGGFILHPWSRLPRFPLFWLGLLFFAYVLCQALNPAYVRVVAGHYTMLAEREHIAWLPSGVDTPFAQMNAWRMLTIWGGAWLLGCALWAGLTRRGAVLAILATLVANGALLALIGILQKVTNAKQVLWFIEPVATYFISTFFYKNHAGAYFNLIAAVALALVAWHHVRSLRRLERSSPAPVYAFAAILLAAMVFMSGSRAAMILLSGFLLVAGIVFLIWRLRRREGATHPAVTALVATAAVALVAGAAWFLNLDKGIEQMRSLGTEKGRLQIQARVLARQATMDLYESNKITGWGAGSFRHVFPLTQQNYESIFKVEWHDTLTYHWDHAHNDFAQALAELGWIGCAFPVIMLLWLPYRAIRRGALGQPAFWLFGLGFALPLAHAWVDFPLYNCAIFVTFCALAVLGVRWVELEASR